MREASVTRPVLRIRIRAPVKPTEDVEKVRGAILSLFPGATVQEGEGELVAEAPDLARIEQLVRSQRIPDSARGVMLAGLSEDGLVARFLLGKQAAAAGRAHFGPLRSPLGDLAVELRGTEPHEVLKLIYQTAPDTTVDPEWAKVPFELRPQDIQGAPPS